MAPLRDDPAAFFRKVLGIEPWSRQLDVINAVRDHDRVAVRSGHKVSKSNTAAGLALWYVTCFPNSRVPMTSSTFAQVRKILWRELRLLYQNAEVGLGGELSTSPKYGLRFDDGREVFGFSTRDAENAAGISSPNILYIVDEASGVPEDIFEAIEGNRAGGAKIVLFSNPTQQSGTFFDAFHGKTEFWKTVHISSEESPNVTGEADIPGLATPEWVEEKRQEWGAESPVYQVRVAGDFPDQSETAVIGLQAVEAARSRHVPEEETEGSVLRIGVDVARYGNDDSVVAPVRGRKAYPLRTYSQLDGPELAGRVLQIARQMRRGDSREKVVVNIDIIGVGSSVYDSLRRSAPKWMTVVGVNVAESADDDQYGGLRTQLTFGLADWLETGSIPEDDALDAELVSPEYTFDSRGRYRLAQSKEQERARLGRSPDRRDALALGVYQTAAESMGRMQTGGRRQSQSALDGYMP
jgi:hypothetical protein